MVARLDPRSAASVLLMLALTSGCSENDAAMPGSVDSGASGTTDASSPNETSGGESTTTTTSGSELTGTEETDFDGDGRDDIFRAGCY